MLPVIIIILTLLCLTTAAAADSFDDSTGNDTFNMPENNNIQTMNKVTNNPDDNTKEFEKDTQAEKSVVYVSTGGNDENTGDKNTPKATLKNALKTVADHGTIHLENGVYNQNKINIDKNITITSTNTGNTIINAMGSHAFTISQNVKVTLSKFTIRNAEDTNGAAIYNKGSLTLNYMKITSNHAKNGAGIYNKGNLVLKKTTFTQNSASAGAAIYNTGTIKSVNTTFDNNKAGHLGSAIYSTNTGKTEINQNNFTSNKNSTIYTSSGKSNSIKNSIFSKNSAVNAAGIYNTRSLSVINVTFNRNTAENYGGAIYNKGQIRLEENRFTSNKAPRGAAIYTTRSISVKNSEFNKNRADYGSIYSTAKLTIENSRFRQNTATKHAGAVYNTQDHNDTIKIINSKFTDNTAELGAALYLRGKSTLNMKNCLFSRNTNNAIYTRTLQAVIENTNFTKNSGAIYNYKTTMNIEKSIFESNGNTDGAIYNHAGKITIKNSILKNNTRTDIYNCHGKITADYNWWNSNSKPGRTQIFNTTVNKWIYLKVTPEVNNKTLTTTISINNINNGKTIKTYNQQLPPVKITYHISGNNISHKQTIQLEKTRTIKTELQTTRPITIKTTTDKQITKETINTGEKITSIFVQIGAATTPDTINEWKNTGITDVYVQTRASKNNTKKLKEVINLCKSTNIRVHAWVICFSTGNGFNISRTQQNMLKNFISQTIKINGISGICLDYVRYSGTNPSIVDPDKITNFVKSVNSIIKSHNKDLQLSACVFPEKAGTKKYYGQDYAALSPYVDVMLPMVYKYDYKAGRNWLKDVTSYVVKQASQSEVVSILQTYKGTTKFTKLTKEELEADAKAVMEAGSNGYSLFRYGLINTYPANAYKLTS